MDMLAPAPGATLGEALRDLFDEVNSSPDRVLWKFRASCAFFVMSEGAKRLPSSSWLRTACGEAQHGSRHYRTLAALAPNYTGGLV
jgi:hypothetical protein